MIDSGEILRRKNECQTEADHAKLGRELLRAIAYGEVADAQECARIMVEGHRHGD